MRKKIIIRVFSAFAGFDTQFIALLAYARWYNQNTNGPLIKYVLVGWCEIDEDAIASHNALFPEYAEEAKLLPGKSEYQGYHYLDISQIEWSKVPDFDLLIYSSCCQSITKAGKQEGTTEDSGTPSSLIWEIREAIRYKRPRVCILENVADLLTNKFDAQFELWRNTVSEFGYRNTWSSMCAADYGVPQNRNRVFLVSVRNDINKSVYFPEPIGCKVSAEDLLENAVDEKYYFSEEDALSFLLDIHDKQPEHNVKIRIEDKGICCKQIITPSCIRKKNKKNKQATQYDLHICPTLVADVNYAKGNYKKFLSSTHYPRPGVIEMWHTTEQVMIPYKELIDSASISTERKFKIINASRNDILEQLDNLGIGDYFRLRRLTPIECFRFMSVEAKDVDKLVNSGVSDDQLVKQAGNAIVIRVLVNLYKSIFEDVSKWWY
jgi:DNA (cytosine-5)-methyltransferase 1